MAARTASRIPPFICGAVALLLLAPTPSEARTAWSTSKATGASGCNENRDTSICVLVRCDAPGRLQTYFQVVEGDPFGDKVRMDIDGRSFPARVDLPVVHAWGTAYKVRPASDGFVAALRNGRRLTLHGAEITGGFDVFSLVGAKAAIDRVASACGVGPDL